MITYRFFANAQNGIRVVEIKTKFVLSYTLFGKNLPSSRVTKEIKNF